MQRYQLTPEKMEMIEGKLLWYDEDRAKLLGLLLENVGADRAARLGDPNVWRAAVRSLDASSTEPCAPRPASLTHIA